MQSSLSYLDLVSICDNVHINRRHTHLPPSIFDSEVLIPFYLSDEQDSPVIGLLRPAIIQQLELENEQSRQHDLPELWSISEKRVSFRPWLDTPAKRTAAMKELCERWRDTGLFEDVCGPKKWRSEMYPVYADPFGVHDYPSTTDAHIGMLNYAFEMERSACALFGVVTYGVHLSIYEEAQVGGQRQLRMWVPTRAKTKPTWPGYLDNTVAGGIPSGLSAFDSLVKECMEEASIEANIVHQHVRAAGAISYFFRTSAGWLQPEIEYVYDLVIPPSIDPTLFQPKPLDGEVEKFELLGHDGLVARLQAGLFKPNCALVVIDLFIRLGYITFENEPDYMEILSRLHSRFDYDKW
ncbi:hypothetical protein AX17_002025 [Amanita inopinata Kibby_2008]|nr:hypothetical protein AX17_002025 [Amanita inopinata Kibby_2008]